MHKQETKAQSKIIRSYVSVGIGIFFFTASVIEQRPADQENKSKYTGKSRPAHEPRLHNLTGSEEETKKPALFHTKQNTER